MHRLVKTSRAFRWVAVALALALSASAQTSGPQVGYVFPAGCQQGATVTLIVGGRQLQGVEQAVFSGAGLSARVVGFERPMSPEERMKLQTELAELRRPTSAAKPAPTEPAPTPTPTPAPIDVPARIAELERRLAEVNRNQATPALADTVTLEVTAAPDAATGPRDLRLLGKGGLSLPLVFMVGDLPEVAFPAVSAITPRAAAGSAKAVSAALAAGLTVTPPVVVNGQILPGESDRIRFTGKRGQRLIVAVHARDLTPYLADAVPGWFQAVAALLDEKGNELAYADDFRFRPDPVLAFQLPADGDYTLVVRDALYRGREDFGYRVALGELPFVAGLFPLGGAPGQEVSFALNGWNLPAPARRARLPAEPGETELDLGRCSAATGGVRVAVDDLPEHLETEPNDTSAQAREVTPPVVVNGRIARAGDADWLRFAAQAGQTLVVEVVARRLRSPLDGTLRIHGADGAVLAANDDNDDAADGLTTHHADPRLVFTPAKDGIYAVRLGDTQHRGGPDYAYRLRLSAPRPDFALRVVPSSVNLRAGGTAKVTVHALRRDGFGGEIALALRDAPAGLRFAPALVPAGADRVELTLSAGRETALGVAPLEWVGTAMIGGASVTHPVVPADDRMQAFFYRHLVPARQGLVAVRRK